MARQNANKGGHEACQTSFTRTGQVDMVNHKPYRTASQKAEARRTAYKDKDGAFRSSAPVSYHTKPSAKVN